MLQRNVARVSRFNGARNAVKKKKRERKEKRGPLHKIPEAEAIKGLFEFRPILVRAFPPSYNRFFPFFFFALYRRIFFEI